MVPVALKILLLVFVEAFAKSSATEVMLVHWDLDQCYDHPPESCGPGWIRLNPDYCVMVPQKMETFDDAEAFCQSEGGHQISISDETTLATMACIFELTSTNWLLHWVGGRRKERGSPEFPWTDASGNVQIPFDDLGESHDCLRQRGSSVLKMPGYPTVASFVTGPCDQVNYFVCQKAG